MFIDSPLSVGGGVLPKEAEVRGSSVFCRDICKEFRIRVARGSRVAQLPEVAEERPTDFCPGFGHGARGAKKPEEKKAARRRFRLAVRTQLRTWLCVHNFDTLLSVDNFK